MSNSEIRQRFPSLYDQPNPAPLPSPEPLSRSQLAAQNPEFYPDGGSGKIPDLPKPEVDQRQFIPQDQLQRENPQFYGPVAPSTPPGPVSDLPARWNVPDTFTPPPSIPVEASPSAPPGTSFITSPGGQALSGGAIGTAVGSIAGIISGQSPDVAVAGALGAGIGGALGAVGGAAIGSAFGPVGTVIGGQLGAALGSVVGGSIGQNIGQGIHNLFFRRC